MVKLVLSALLGALLGMFVIYRLGLPPPPDPRGALGSLNDRELSRLYDTAFWLSEERSGDDLWNRAYTYCTTPATYADGAPRPNCAVVQLIRAPTIATQIAATEVTRRWLGNGTDKPVGDGVTGFGGQRAGQLPTLVRPPTQQDKPKSPGSGHP